MVLSPLFNHKLCSGHSVNHPSDWPTNRLNRDVKPSIGFIQPVVPSPDAQLSQYNITNASKIPIGATFNQGESDRLQPLAVLWQAPQPTGQRYGPFES